MALGPPGRQCRILHRQPPHAVVHGGFCDGRRSHLGRDVHLGSGIRGRRLVLLHADGRGIHRGAAARGLPADPHVLPPEGRLALRIPRRPLRGAVAPHGGMVLLHLENPRRGAARLRGLRGAAAAGLLPLRTAVLGQCPRHDAARLALYAAGRREVADLDRYAQDGVPCGEPCADDHLHHARPRSSSSTTPPRGAISGRCSSRASCC